METATLVAIFISGLFVSFTRYVLYIAFGQPSQQLRDPFEKKRELVEVLGLPIWGDSLL
ncbi:protein psbn [Phtheirospermum japonicum]|uniref:Protein psbn n=1 Tax=Phtheirospermum japonicum TaxID=374723 RepID=A0A830BQ40_9LAMI|nr:protein psbn [Phtheirospermum japonicum]